MNRYEEYLSRHNLPMPNKPEHICVYDTNVGDKFKFVAVPGARYNTWTEYVRRPNEGTGRRPMVGLVDAHRTYQGIEPSWEVDADALVEVLR